jgi:hypothetical protein
MSENKTIIGDREIAVGIIPPTKAIRVQVAIASLCGEGLFKAVAEKSDNPTEAGAAMLSALTSKLDSDVLLGAMTTVFEYVSIDNKRIASIDSAFIGRNKELWQVLFFALKVNFSDFFSGDQWASIAGKVTSTLSPSLSPISTGTSGAQS